MKPQSLLSLCALLALAPSAHADAPVDVPIAPIVVKFRYARAYGDSRVISELYALEGLNHRFGNGLNDGDGWSGVGKARLKFSACPTGLTFKGITSIGLNWKRTNTGNPEEYTGTITRMRCG